MSSLGGWAWPLALVAAGLLWVAVVIAVRAVLGHGTTDNVVSIGQQCRSRTVRPTLGSTRRLVARR